MKKVNTSSKHLKYDLSSIDCVKAFLELSDKVPSYSDLSVIDCFKYVYTPINLKQCAVLIDTEYKDKYRGFVTWGWLDKEQELRYIAKQSKPEDFKYSSEEDVLWILDLIAPYGYKDVWHIVRDLTDHFTDDPRMKDLNCGRALRTNGRLVKFNKHGIT